MHLVVGNESMLALLGLGGGEILLILALILILFGARQLPRLTEDIQPRMLVRLLKAVTELLKGIDQGASDAGRSLGGIYGKPAAQALTPDNQVAELYDPAVFQKKQSDFWKRSKGFVTMAIGLASTVLLVWVIYVVWGNR